MSFSGFLWVSHLNVVFLKNYFTNELTGRPNLRIFFDNLLKQILVTEFDEIFADFRLMKRLLKGKTLLF